MIPRYSRQEMTRIWEPENKYRIWLEIETLAAEKMAELGLIDKSAPAAIRERGNFDINRIDEIEKETRHDVIAFLTNVAEYVGEEARSLHQGMTSSDVLDTSLAVQLVQSCELLEQDLEDLLKALETRAKEHKNTICIGRSHGIHAEPTTFGLKLAGHYAAFSRGLKRLKQAKKEIGTCAISGAVGTYATVPPEIESYVAEKLGLNLEPVSTQIIPRDRHAVLATTLGVIASSIENLATEIRHLQRSEVREAEEFFAKGQKGSSAMPHKRNPILSENLTGLARIVRANVTPALENVTLWHERDISHSSVERTLLPDSCIALDFALTRLKNVVENLVVYPEAMQNNLNRLGGLHFSQKVLLALTRKGLSREEAYQIVQSNAMKVWDNLGQKNLREILMTDARITDLLNDGELDDIFDNTSFTKYVDTIFKRLFDS